MELPSGHSAVPFKWDSYALKRRWNALPMSGRTWIMWVFSSRAPKTVSASTAALMAAGSPVLPASSSRMRSER